MANFVASNLVAAQAKFNQRFSEQELRRKQNPALMLALNNLSATIPDHMALRTREDRAVNAYLFKRRAASNGTARAARPTGSKGDSVQVGLTWQTISETFSISMKQGDNNVFSNQEMLMNELLQAAQNMHDRLGTLFQTFLITNRNQVPLDSPSGATWNGASYDYEIDQQDRVWFFQKLASIMNQHNYRGQLDVIADPAAFQMAQQLRAQGAQNAQNLTFQFDNMNVIQTTEEITEGYAGSALAMPAGTFAALPWIPKQNREGKGSYDDYNGGWGTMADPLGATITGLDANGQTVSVPLTYSVYAFSAASDDNAANGYYQDLVTTFEISLDVAPTLAPLSTADESVVMEFGLKAA